MKIYSGHSSAQISALGRSGMSSGKPAEPRRSDGIKSWPESSSRVNLQLTTYPMIESPQCTSRELFNPDCDPGRILRSGSLINKDTT